jgi:hypothetical protein
MIDGAGDPNTGAEYRDAISALALALFRKVHLPLTQVYATGYGAATWLDELGSSGRAKR